MLNNLFRKTYFSSFFVGAISLFSILHFTYPQNSLIDALVKATCILLIIAGLLFLENKYRSLGIRQIHVLSSSLTLLYVPSQEISYIALFLISCLFIAFHNATRRRNTHTSAKGLFNLSFVITGISFFEPFLAFLFITPLLFFKDQQYQNRKHILAFFLPIISFFIMFYSVVFAFKIQYTFPWQKIGEFRGDDIFKGEELLWGAFVLWVILSVLKVTAKEHLKVLKAGNFFLFFCLIIGLFIGLFEIESNFQQWGLLYVPLAYLLGIVLHYMSKRDKNLVVVILLIVRLGVFLI